MLSRARNTKVFVITLVSIALGAVILKTLGENPPLAGAFSLSEYYGLAHVEKVISSDIVQSNGQWNCIEIAYSGTKSGNIKQLASLNGLTNPEDINYHFVVCNGLGSDDGQIQPTEKWKRQWSVTPAQTLYTSEQTIHICVIADIKIARPTDMQIKRTEALAEELSRKLNINSASIYYPDNWR